MAVFIKEAIFMLWMIPPQIPAVLVDRLLHLQIRQLVLSGPRMGLVATTAM